MKSSIKAVAVAAALIAGNAMASPINRGGVIWDPVSFFDFSSTDTMIETIVNSVGSEVHGYAKITTLNGTGEATFCPGCELTYVFSGYILSDIDGATGAFTFSGGHIDVFVDHTPNFDATKQSTAADGTLFLSLDGHSHVDGATGKVGTLHSDPTPASVGVAGDGRGFLDAVGGLAVANFDTNTFAVIDDLAGTPGFADFLFTSSFQLIRGGTFVSDDGLTYGLFGSNDLSGDSIPEPTSIALLGIGLAGLGAYRRRKAGA